MIRFHALHYYRDDASPGNGTSAFLNPFPQNEVAEDGCRRLNLGLQAGVNRRCQSKVELRVAGNLRLTPPLRWRPHGPPHLAHPRQGPILLSRPYPASAHLICAAIILTCGPNLRRHPNLRMPLASCGSLLRARVYTLDGNKA